LEEVDTFLERLKRTEEGIMYLKHPDDGRPFYKHYVFKQMDRTGWQIFFDQLDKDYFMVSTHACTWDELERHITNTLQINVSIQTGREQNYERGNIEPIKYCKFHVSKNPFREAHKIKEKPSKKFYFDISEIVKDF